MQIAAARTTLQDVTEQALDGADLGGAVERVRQWMFIERFAEDVARAEDRATGPSR